MKRNLIVALTLVALSLGTASAIFAQDKVRADVPFAFQVGKSSLPAGTYTVTKIGDHAIAIRSHETSAGSLAIYSTDQKLKNQSSKMVFHKYGNTYFLAEIWDGSGASGMQLRETKREQELRAASLGADSQAPIVLAMK